MNAYKSKSDHTTDTRRRAQECYLAIILLSAVDCNRAIGRLLQEINNDTLKGHSTFPATLEEALSMLNDCSSIAPATWATDGYEEVAFAQKLDEALTTQSKVKEAYAVLALYQQGDSKTKGNSGVI